MGDGKIDQIIAKLIETTEKIMLIASPIYPPFSKKEPIIRVLGHDPPEVVDKALRLAGFSWLLMYKEESRVLREEDAM